MSDAEYRQACADAKAAGLDFGKYVRKLVSDRHRPPEKTSRRDELARFVERVSKLQARIQPLVPEVDPHDLNLILSRMLTPLEKRRYFHRRVGKRYVR